MLHPELDTILSMCQDAGLTVNLTTNGTLLYRKLFTLIKHPVHQINVSMHSADDNDCIDMDNYINELFYSCDEILEKQILRYLLDYGILKMSQLFLERKTSTNKKHTLCTMYRVHLNGLSLTAVIAMNVVSVRDLEHI